MATALWIAVWVVVLGTVAFLAVRQVRSGRKGPADVDRTRHEAVRESTMRSQVNGPGGIGSSFGP
jgi:hypothetical protein